jgi:peroxiredoxin Q/BCP
MKIIISIIVIAILSLSFVAIQSSSGQEVDALKKGDKLPDFKIKDQDGNMFHVAEYVGKKNLVIYFYPKDDTPGCTKEACKFRDEFEAFTDLNAMVIGISADSPESHTEFIEKYNLPFTLLSDENNEVRELFGVKGKFMNIIPGRVSYIVGKEGIVQYVFDSMGNAEQHIVEAIKTLESLK